MIFIENYIIVENFSIFLKCFFRFLNDSYINFLILNYNMAKMTKISIRFKAPKIKNTGDVEWLKKEIKKLGWDKEGFKID